MSTLELSGINCQLCFLKFFFKFEDAFTMSNFIRVKTLKKKKDKNWKTHKEKTPTFAKLCGIDTFNTL